MQKIQTMQNNLKYHCAVYISGPMGSRRKGIMRQKGYTPVGVPNELVELVDMVCKERNGFVSRQDFVRSSIMNHLERLGYYAAEPRMEVQHTDNGKKLIIIKDNKLHKHVSVSFRKRKLFCDDCSSLDCDHLKVARNLAIVQGWARNNGLNL